jgi:hypothetical protein
LRVLNAFEGSMRGPGHRGARACGGALAFAFAFTRESGDVRGRGRTGARACVGEGVRWRGRARGEGEGVRGRARRARIHIHTRKWRRAGTRAHGDEGVRWRGRGRGRGRGWAWAGEGGAGGRVGGRWHAGARARVSVTYIYDNVDSKVGMKGSGPVRFEPGS